MRALVWFLTVVGGPIIRIEHWVIGLFGYTYDPITGVIVSKSPR